jgi:hypothetical protein
VFYSTAEEARPHKPAQTGKFPMRLFRVQSPGGAVVFLWARGHDHAVYSVAKKDGYLATSADKTATKETVAAGLAQLSPEDRAALLAQLQAESGKGKRK